uniref:Tafazzin family protein n=1 Tax=Bicosoecida sp. CB-2014 TaxID=1486930 RepID=A0A7S1G2E3_9STRA|mmetsp:Transcript_11496/g.40108  ORF Transcript_11496/g.40108 Transcript_11496/m.40108 type:complete len:425 (+) Transcript_11496:42-1316(+)
MWRAARRVVVPATAVTTVACWYTAYKYRPRGSWEVDYHKAVEENPELAQPNKVEAKLIDLARYFAVWPVGIAERALMRILNRSEIIDHEKLTRFVDPAARDGRAMVTVANHVSTLDDPFLVTRLLPPSVFINPRLLRWSVCSEELCFFNDAIGTFFGVGRVIPITRGGGILQPSLDTVAGKVREGQWVHFFPEGRVWQEGGLPLRDDDGRWCSVTGRCSLPFAKVGPIKWGIGRVIANAPKPPIVVPIFHLGLENVVPQDFKNDVKSMIPKIGNRITAKVGDPVPVEDLIDAYFAKAAERAAAREERREALRRRGKPLPPPASHPAAGEGVGDEFESEVKAEAEVAARSDGKPHWQQHHFHAGLRIKPPDHELLTEEQALEEEAVRLKLYSAISQRLWAALAGLEADVREYRRSTLGVEEKEQR